MSESDPGTILFGRKKIFFEQHTFDERDIDKKKDPMSWHDVMARCRGMHDVMARCRGTMSLFFFEQHTFDELGRWWPTIARAEEEGRHGVLFRSRDID